MKIARLEINASRIAKVTNYPQAWRKKKPCCRCSLWTRALHKRQGVQACVVCRYVEPGWQPSPFVAASKKKQSWQSKLSFARKKKNCRQRGTDILTPLLKRSLTRHLLVLEQCDLHRVPVRFRSCWAFKIKVFFLDCTFFHNACLCAWSTWCICSVHPCPYGKGTPNSLGTIFNTTNVPAHSLSTRSYFFFVQISSPLQRMLSARSHSKKPWTQTLGCCSSLANSTNEMATTHGLPEAVFFYEFDVSWVTLT